MGTDIHAMGEWCSFATGDQRWVCAGELRLGRDYELFELLGGRGGPRKVGIPGIPGIRDWDGTFDGAAPNGRVFFEHLASEPFRAWAASYAPDGHSHGWASLEDLAAHGVAAPIVQQAERMGASRVCFFFDS